MAIVQISRITNRKGLQENLPQLAGAELGWSVDQRRLFIGNGTLEQGAPVIGNTEILTEFSDIFAFQTTYTYKGLAAGYEVETGPTASTPITQSLQSWLDQFATVKDFGAVGDGVTDDTDAINRALYQLFCRETNPQIRRSLFFPAGVYRVNQTIKIPPYATLYGEGADNSVIEMGSGDDSTLRAYVARTADSLQQTGVQITDNGATAPGWITIKDLGFATVDPDVDVFLVEDANNVTFQSVNFVGPLTTGDLTTDADDIAGVRFSNTNGVVTNNITFDRCYFSGLTYGINTDQQIKGVTVINSDFDVLYKGVALGTGVVVDGGSTGFKVLHSVFDNIYEQGIIFGNVQFNSSGYNIFYDVGNHFNGSGSPASTIIVFNDNNNVSLGDMFERDDTDAAVFPRIDINQTLSIAMTNGAKLALGTYERDSGKIATLTNNTTGNIFSTDLNAFTVNYTISRDDSGLCFRTGTLAVANYDGKGTLTWSDDFSQNTSTGVTLSLSQSSGTVTLAYNTTNTGTDANFSYSINSLT